MRSLTFVMAKLTSRVLAEPSNIAQIEYRQETSSIYFIIMEFLLLLRKLFSPHITHVLHIPHLIFHTQYNFDFFFIFNWCYWMKIFMGKKTLLHNNGVL